MFAIRRQIIYICLRKEKDMNCVICGCPIDGYRLALNPRIKTCSPQCSKRHAKNLRNLAARNKRKRARQQKETL